MLKTAGHPRGRVSFCVTIAFACALSVVEASGVPRVPVNELGAGSEVILTGRVDEVAVGWDLTVSGIYSYVTIRVDRVLKGDLSEPTIVLKQLGGALADEGMNVPGQARFRAGEQVLLFLERRPRDGTLYTAGLWQGKWNTSEGPSGTVATQSDPEGVLPPLSVALPALAGSIDVGRRTGEPLTIHPPERSVASQPFTLYNPPVRWFTTPVIVNVMTGAQPGLATGGFGEIVNAAAQLNAAGSGLQLVIGQRRPARCLMVNQNTADILVTFDDPCGEVSNVGNTYGYTWYYWVGNGGSMMNGILFNRIVQATITSNDTAAARSFVSTPSCYQTLMLHELGHAIGLDHTTNPSTIMFPIIPNSCAGGALPLTADDVAGLLTIYSAINSRIDTAPTNIVATVNGATLTVSFTGVADSASSSGGYQLDFRQDPSGPVVASVTSSLTTVTVAIPPGVVGTFYVSVTAFNKAGTGPPAAPIAFTIGPNTCSGPPPAPVEVSGTVSIGVAAVRWDLSPTATSYIVQAGSIPGASNLFNGNVGNANVVSASGVAPEFQAYVRVIAVNSCGQSLPSAEILVK